jgi:hypothetical protein
MGVILVGIAASPRAPIGQDIENARAGLASTSVEVGCAAARTPPPRSLPAGDTE